ncbi:hypothetical protein FPE01S_06_00780 [Flavihumibacter petaseus NBRC 106054]|uniref:PKD domain-containing protein n=2 Tax=Flavihumibacter TaxID=1004301 RepID=A0A0E9N6L3_9BACT|nr:hypothetical protein FPE01S_06_00780 [Flavihumibacter petaseus NBRC 106054]
MVFVLSGQSLLANHIRGGELSYKYLGAGSTAGTSRYLISLKLFIDCFQNNQGQFDQTVPFTVFRKSDNRQIGSPAIAPFRNQERVAYDPNSNPCILNPPTDICYNLRYYTQEITLPDDPDGYIISFQRCCRIANINNISGSSDDYGATYMCEIPGTKTLPAAEHNNSPLITGFDAVAICAGSAFTFDFSAKDDDKDELVYELCNAYTGGGRTQDQSCYTCPTPNPAAPPPYNSVPYRIPYNGPNPMGNQVSINSSTGIITGIAPQTTGQYVVTVCISEYRHNKLINVHRKDIHLTVSNCQPLSAVLSPDYHFCDDFNVTFQNGQANPAGSTYVWEYGDGSKKDTVTTALGMVRHQYKDTGTYRVKLYIYLANGACTDETETLAKVYPGFLPDFSSLGSCLLTPFRFTDKTFARYGTVSKWSWEFGDETVDTDISTVRNPVYQYHSLGIKTVKLTVESSFGCIGTISHDIEVRDKPNLEFPFTDTLICSIDTLQLIAEAPGTLNPVFSWTPSYNIINPATPTPRVHPKQTTTYFVNLNDNGCVNSGSVTVRVVDRVTLRMMPDTTICLTDPAQLRTMGDGLKFEWSPAASLLDPFVANPIAVPTATTTYSVISRIGGCSATGSVSVKTVPYPGAFAGPDQVICYDDTTQLSATIAGASFTWTPTSTLLMPRTLTPFAFPLRTTAYILTVVDNIGCPKPGRDTVVVTVRPPVQAFAGNDTSIVVNQPLHLNATGGDVYQWSPSTGLNATDIPDPTAILSSNQTYAVRVATLENCFAFDTIRIKVFKTNPDIFVPNAFTPGSATNSVFRPIPVGISRLEYFQVYNRYGQMVFSTSEAGRGWDGRINGQYQATGTFVWVVKGTDYTGKSVFKKGTVVLIR